MRKIYVFLTLLAAMAVALPPVQAQDEVTVADGTQTSDRVPVYGTFIDAAQHNQFIYPASMLEELDGTLISSITFYLSDAVDATWAGTQFTVKLGIVDDVTVTSYSFVQSNTLTEVWSGELSNENEIVVFEFDSPYEYSGGNLLVDITSTQQYNLITTYGTGYFLGISTDSYASLYSYTTSLQTPASPSSAYYFLPKATFVVEPNNGDYCYKVKNLTLTDITADGVSVSWTDTSNSSATYTVAAVANGDTTLFENISGNSHTITGLASNTAYTIMVRTECSAESQSGWAKITMRTDCNETMSLPYATTFGSGEFNTETYVPLCWYQLRTSDYIYNDAIYTQPLIWGNVGVDGTGDNALGFAHQNATDTGMICTSVLPEGDLQISFWMTVSTGHAEVGFITDTADLSTFSPVMTLEAGNDYREYDIYTASHPEAAGARLAFYAEGLTSAFIDNLSVKESNGCHRPLTSRVASYTYNTATVVWDDPEGTAWQLSCSTQPADTADGSSTATVAAATGSGHTLTGLQPGTTYYVWVRTVCDDGNSHWRTCGSFTTDLSCYEVADLAVGNNTGTTAVATWTYAGNGRGIEETGATVTLTDNTDNTSSSQTVTGTYAFLTDLQAGHSYSVSVRTLCDTDTAQAANASFAISTCGETEQGAYASNNYPDNAYYNYSYYQSIYSGSTVAGMDTIYGIAVHHSSSNVVTRTLDVYMTTTNLATLSSPVPMTTADRVYSGSYTYSAADGDWDTITFATPFVHNSSDNLLITFDDNTGTYAEYGTYPQFYYHYGSQNVTYYYNDDTQNVDPANPGNSLYSNNSQADMRFIGNCQTDNDCPAPNIAVGSTDETSAALVWIAGDSESQWTVQYCQADSTDNWQTAGTATDTTFTVTGLSPRSHYMFRVGYTCGDQTIYSPTASAYTGCEALNELPFSDSFENMPINSDPLCWQFFSLSSNTSHYVSSNGHGDNSQCMYVYPYGDSYLASPAMPAGTDPTQLEISWWATYPSSTSATYEVGLMTNPTDPSTFRRIFVTGGNNNTWTEYTAYADTVTLGPTETVYVAFRYSSMYNSVKIDDVNIAIASCRRLTGVHTTAVSDTSATIAWPFDEADATFEYCVTTTSTVPAGTTVQTTNGTSVTIEGLQPNTVYYAWVRLVCEDGSSQWSPECAILTSCGAEPTPWAENFDTWTEMSTCWSLYTGAFDTVPTLTPTTNGWYPSSDYYGSSIAINGSALCVNLYSNYKYWAVSTGIAAEGDLAISFDIAVSAWYSPTPAFDNDDRLIVAVSANGGYNWTPVYQFGSDPTRDDMDLNDLNNSYTTITANINGYDGQTIKIAFVATSDYLTTGDNRIVIDNIEVFSSACMRPTSVTVSATDESADLSWVDNSTDNEAGYVLLICSTDNIDSALQTITTTDTFYTVNGLDAMTTYHYYLRSACNENPDATSWTHGSFRTTCAGGNCEFTIEMADAYGDGWTGNSIDIYQLGELVESVAIDDGYSSVATVSTCLGSPVALTWTAGDFPEDASFVVKDANDSVLLTSGLMTYHNTGDSIMTFDGQCSATVLLNDNTNPGGNCDAPTALSATATESTVSVTWSGTAFDYEVGIVAGSSWDEATADIEDTEDTEYEFSDLTAGTQYTIGVRSVCYNLLTYEVEYSSWTTTTISTTGGAPADECLVPTALAAISVDSTTATLNWTAGGNETQWQLMLNDDAANPLTATSKPYVMSNLTPSTTYSVKVRALCSANNTSDWSAPVSFTTTAGPDNSGILAADAASVAIWPNPASTTVSIEATSEATITIVDQSGREVYRSATPDTRFEVNVATWAKGVYFVRLTGSTATATGKVIVE